MKPPATTAELERRVAELDRELAGGKPPADCPHRTATELCAMLDSIGDHIIMMSPDLRILWANQAAHRVFGGDLVGRPCHEALHRRELPCEPHPCFVLKTFADGQTHQQNIQVLRRDGERLHFCCTANVALRDDDGRPSAVIDIARDVSEMVWAQEALNETTKKLRQALGATIQAIARTVETRDPYTAGHQRRVADLARAIAQKMGLGLDQIDAVRMAGVIHDLGKISIPAEILSKPGRLTETEFALIKEHPVTGHSILLDVEFNWPLAEIVLQHHERMDGSGYPYGLSGDAIMLEARILAVADVVEAMSSHRPYRPAHELDLALGEISQRRGGLYDAAVVDACLHLFHVEGFAFRDAPQNL